MRECARAQGFPDRYEFLPGENGIKDVSNKNNFPATVHRANGVEQMYRQIGNAVPVPLALALGRALGETIVNAALQGRDPLGLLSPSDSEESDEGSIDVYNEGYNSEEV